eukprot:1982194-Ditylum_brightwellii.AAC.2
MMFKKQLQPQHNAISKKMMYIYKIFPFPRSEVRTIPRPRHEAKSPETCFTAHELGVYGANNE